MSYYIAQFNPDKGISPKKYANESSDVQQFLERYQREETNTIFGIIIAIDGYQEYLLPMLDVILKRFKDHRIIGVRDSYVKLQPKGETNATHKSIRVYQNITLGFNNGIMNWRNIRYNLIDVISHAKRYFDICNPNVQVSHRIFGEEREISRTHPTIFLANFKFEMLELYLFDDGRDILKMRSTHVRTGNILEYYIYRSNSDLGMWRLAEPFWDKTKKRYTKFDKGADYVASTKVSIYLQLFINAKIEKLSRSSTVITLNMLATHNKNMDIKKLIDVPPNPARLIPKDDKYVFDLINECQATSCLQDADTKIYNQRMDSLGVSQALRDVHNKIKGEPGGDVTVYLLAIKDATNAMMESHFKQFDFPPGYLGKFTHMIDSHKFELKFYNELIQSKKTGTKYMFYYSIYEFAGKQYKCVQSINMLTGDGKNQVEMFNKYGLSEPVIAAGILMTKPVEYKVQLNKRSNMGTSLNETYAFIGNFADKIWPRPKM